MYCKKIKLIDENKEEEWFVFEDNEQGCPLKIWKTI